MLVKFGNFEIDIKVRSTLNEDGFNDLETFYFLNELSIIAKDAAMQNEAEGYDSLAFDYAAKAREVYDQLKAAGFYKKVGAAC